MSHPVNQELLERLFEEGLELGLSEDEASDFAWNRFWELADG